MEKVHSFRLVEKINAMALGLVMVMSAGTLMSPQQVHASTEIHVPADFSAIQAAINAASPGDTIQVAPGTYTQQLTITKSLTLEGEESSSTIIQGPSALTADAFGLKGVIEISNGAEVTISGFTITNEPTTSNCGTIHFGIAVFGGATLSIESSTITDIHDNPESGCQNGIGILVGKKFAFGVTIDQVGHATIKDVTVTRYQKGGIVVDNTGSTATVKDNVVEWGFTPFNIASNGIQVSRGAVADVSHNKVTDNKCAASSCGPDLLNQDQATGILLFKAGAGTIVEDNEVSNNDVGIFVFDSSSDTEVKGNTATSNPDAGIALADGTYTASDNEISGPGNVGIAVIAFGTDTSATLKDNEITGVTTPIGTFANTGFTASFTLLD